MSAQKTGEFRGAGYVLWAGWSLRGLGVSHSSARRVVSWNKGSQEGWAQGPGACWQGAGKSRRALQGPLPSSQSKKVIDGFVPEINRHGTSNHQVTKVS